MTREEEPIMRILCFLGIHKLEIVKTQNFRDCSWDEIGVRMTRVLRKCKSCGKRKSQSIIGQWSLEDLK